MDNEQIREFGADPKTVERALAIVRMARHLNAERQRYSADVPSDDVQACEVHEALGLSHEHWHDWTVGVVKNIRLGKI